MIDGLTGPLVSERRLRDLSLRTAVVVLLSAIGLGFGTFAAYDSLRSSQGPTIAALIVAATYGLLAIASWALARHRPDPTGPTSVTADVAAAPLLSGNVGSMLQLLTVSATGGAARTRCSDAVGSRSFADATGRSFARCRLHGGKKSWEVVDPGQHRVQLHLRRLIPQLPEASRGPRPHVGV
jgi:hypothetical protein